MRDFLYVLQVIESFAIQFSFQLLFLSVPYFALSPISFFLYPSYFLIAFFSFYTLSQKMYQRKSLGRTHRQNSKCHKTLKPRREVRSAYVSPVFLRRSFVRCIWKWEIRFLHTIFARRSKIENKCQRASKAKYIYITPQHIFIFIFRLMTFKMSLLF